MSEKRTREKVRAKIAKIRSETENTAAKEKPEEKTEQQVAAEETK